MSPIFYMVFFCRGSSVCFSLSSESNFIHGDLVVIGRNIYVTNNTFNAHYTLAFECFRLTSEKVLVMYVFFFMYVCVCTIIISRPSGGHQVLKI